MYTVPATGILNLSLPVLTVYIRKPKSKHNAKHATTLTLTYPRDVIVNNTCENRCQYGHIQE